MKNTIKMVVGIIGLLVLVWMYLHYESILKEHWLSRNLREIQSHTLPKARPVGLDLALAFCRERPINQQIRCANMARDRLF